MIYLCRFRMDDSPYCSKCGCTPENLEQAELERLSESEPKLQNMVRKMLTSQENWRQKRGRKNDGAFKGQSRNQEWFWWVRVLHIVAIFTMEECQRSIHHRECDD